MKYHPSLNENNLNASPNPPSPSSSVATSVDTDRVTNLLRNCDSNTLLPLVALFSTYQTALPRGIISSQLLPAFAVCWRQAMATSSHYPYPISSSARVSSSSLVSSEDDKLSKDSYLRPVTRSITRAGSRSQGRLPQGRTDKISTNYTGHANSRSRKLSQPNHCNDSISGVDTEAPAASTVVRRKVKDGHPKSSKTANGHLSSENKAKPLWRDISRSQSPLGLIPIHRNWRSFIHRHEVPRKVLHVSIGFIVLFLYGSGFQPSQITPVLAGLLVPIAGADILRHRFSSFNALYVRVLGALMRESEFHGYNGTIWYLLGTLGALQLFPKDIGVVSVLLLSWCDTAASTFGRLLGHLTPRVRRGKSLAGSLAAATVGAGSAALFWGYVAPKYGAGYDFGANSFAFQGQLACPHHLSNTLRVPENYTAVSGGAALALMSAWSGIVASFSEMVDLFGWDDNFTIPILCGAGLWGFLLTFG